MTEKLPLAFFIPTNSGPGICGIALVSLLALSALEKHIVDRFIHGKPEIDVNIPVISFKTDIVQITGFAKVRKSIPQMNISYSGIQLPSYRVYCTH